MSTDYSKTTLEKTNRKTLIFRFSNLHQITLPLTHISRNSNDRLHTKYLGLSERSIYRPCRRERVKLLKYVLYFRYSSFIEMSYIFLLFRDYKSINFARKQ